MAGENSDITACLAVLCVLIAIRFYRTDWSRSRLIRWLDSEDWQRRHFMMAPFGVTTAVYLLTHFYEDESRPVWKNLDDAKDYVELGTVLYGVFAVLILEGGLRLFYFFAKRRQELNEAEERGKAAAFIIAMGAANDDEVRRSIREAAIADGIAADLLPASDLISVGNREGELTASGAP